MSSHLAQEVGRGLRRTSESSARRLPSTSTFTVPSGRRRSWMMCPIVPTSKMSSGVGVVGLGLLLRGEQDLLVGGHRLFEGGDGLLAADEQRDDHVREDDDVAQGKERNATHFGKTLYADRGRGPDRHSTSRDTTFARRNNLRPWAPSANYGRGFRGGICPETEAAQTRPPRRGSPDSIAKTCDPRQINHMTLRHIRHVAGLTTRGSSEP